MSRRRVSTPGQRAESRRRMFTPEQRDERRRPSSASDEASWIADIRAQGVDVTEFLQATLPPLDATDFPDTDSQEESSYHLPRRQSKGRLSLLMSQISVENTEADRQGESSYIDLPRRLSKQQRSSLMSQISGQSENAESDRQGESSYIDLPRRKLSNEQRASLMSQISVQTGDTGASEDTTDEVKEHFSGFLNKCYVYDETVGDMIPVTFEEISQKRWEKEVEEDSKNYDPSKTTEEKILENKEWAVRMALKRAAEAGYEPAPEKTPNADPPNNPIFPKVSPPPVRPLPKIDERDLDIPVPPMDPRKLGIFPPPLPYRPIDLVPKAAESSRGVSDGMVLYDSDEDEPCDSDTMVVSCINDQCAAILDCSRGAALVRCEDCNTVSPACPVGIRGGAMNEDDTTEKTRDTGSSAMDSSATLRAVHSYHMNSGPGPEDAVVYGSEQDRATR